MVSGFINLPDYAPDQFSPLPPGYVYATDRSGETVVDAAGRPVVVPDANAPVPQASFPWIVVGALALGLMLFTRAQR